MIIFSDSRDPIWNSRDPNRVPKTPQKKSVPYECLEMSRDKITPLWKLIGETPEIQWALTGATQVNSVTRANDIVFVVIP